MTANDHSEEFDRNTDPAQANLGEMLRSARELRERSVEDIARCLRLEPRIVRHLENNEFDQLPVPAFTRGYVRSIAKELEIDNQPLMSVLELRYSNAPPALADFESRAPAQITSDSNIIRYTTAAIVVVMIIMVVSWWRSHEDLSLADRDVWSQSDAQPDPPASAPLDYEFEIVEHPQATFLQVAPEPRDAPMATTTNEAVVEQEAATGELPTEAGADAIVISTQEDAWIEVRDAAGARLFYNFARPGNDVHLNGQAPYALTIGNADAVSVRFNGTAVGVDEYSERGIARFKLDDDVGAVAADGL